VAWLESYILPFYNEVFIRIRTIRGKGMMMIKKTERKKKRGNEKKGKGVLNS
jgi:hypothetical protein